MSRLRRKLCDIGRILYASFIYDTNRAATEGEVMSKRPKDVRCENCCYWADARWSDEYETENINYCCRGPDIVRRSITDGCGEFSETWPEPYRFGVVGGPNVLTDLHLDEEHICPLDEFGVPGPCSCGDPECRAADPRGSL